MGETRGVPGGSSYKPIIHHFACRWVYRMNSPTGIWTEQAKAFGKTAAACSPPSTPPASCFAETLTPFPASIVPPVEVEQIEQVADGRGVGRHVGIVPVRGWVGKVVAAAQGEWLQSPVALDELVDGNVIVVLVRDVSRPRKR